MADVDLAALVRRYWTEAWSGGQLDVLDELVGASLIRHSRHGTVERTPAQLKDDLRQYRRFLRGMVPEFHHQTVDGDLVWSRLTTSGVEEESGEPHRVEWLVLHRFEGHRMAEVWQLYEADVRWKT